MRQLATQGFYHTRFAVLQSPWKPGVYLDSPTAIRSLDDVARWATEFGVTPLAFVSIEFSNKHLTEGARKFIQDFDGMPSRLLSFLREPFTTTLRKLINLDADLCVNGDVLNLDFQILNVDGQGIITEISNANNVAGDVEWWSKISGGLPGPVVGHISIEVYQKLLSDYANRILDAINRGEPEALEDMLSKAVARTIGSN